MLNIISKAYCRNFQSGPKKVVDNLVKGLRRLNYPLVINKQLDACQRLWIHDDMEAVRQAVHLPEEIKITIGPNLVVLPRNLPTGLNLSRFVYIHPSAWSKQCWEDYGFDACPIVAIPTGIDTDEFVPSANEKKFVLVYLKQRTKAELSEVTSALATQRIHYKVLTYPNYREAEYKKLLAETRYVVWLGRQESQGIALQEALACNVPMLVCDVTHIGQWQASPEEMATFNDTENAHWATSAEFFDDTCGIKITNLAQVADALTNMESRLPQFHPREYVLNNLSLEREAREFLRIYDDYYHLSLESGRTEPLWHAGKWANRSIKNRSIFLAKDAAKSVLRFIGRHRS